MADGESETLAGTDPSQCRDEGGSKRAREDAELESNGEKRAKLDSEKVAAAKEEPGKSLEPPQNLDECASNNGEGTAKIDSEKEPGKSPSDDAEMEPSAADDAETEPKSVAVGPKSFITSVEMFDYFYKLLHAWPPNLDVNKYEHMALLELLKKGHSEADRKIGKGIKAFQVRFHPQFKSRCFFLLRVDDSEDDFSFRKCVNHILPLPESMQIKHDANKALRGKGGGRGRGRGRGRGGK